MKKLLPLLLLLAACEPSEPHWRRHCVETKTETEYVYWPVGGGMGTLGVTPGGVGINMGGGMHLVTTTECVRYDSVWVVPDTTE